MERREREALDAHITGEGFGGQDITYDYDDFENDTIRGMVAQNPDEVLSDEEEVRAVRIVAQDQVNYLSDIFDVLRAIESQLVHIGNAIDRIAEK
jgi:hypothetical protein